MEISITWRISDFTASTRPCNGRIQGTALGEYADKIFVGLQTSADQVFILEQHGKRFWSGELGSEVDLEPTYLHPLLKGSVHMKRWLLLVTSQVVLFPYEMKGNAFELVTAEHFQKRAPLTWDYMLKCRTPLASRDRGTTTRNLSRI